MQNNKITSSDWDFEDLKTPEHDEMILWLLQEDNLRKLLRKDKDIEIKEIKTEVPVIAGSNHYIMGYIDLVVRVNWMETDLEGNRKIADTFVLYYEIKPKIDNFGAIVRQINKYRECSYTGEWVLFTNDINYAKFRKAFESQKINTLYWGYYQSKPK